MKLEVKITASSLRIRKGASSSSATVGYLSSGAVVTVIKEQNGFYYLSDARGWIGKKYTSLVKNLESNKSPAKSNNKTDKINTSKLDNTKQGVGIDKKIIEMMYQQALKKEAEFSASTRMFGSPHQFTAKTDFRLGKEEYGLGRKYTEAMITEAPIVYFLPGKPSYLPDLSTKERDAVSNSLLAAVPGNLDNKDKSVLDNILGEDPKYFTFSTDYASYMRYVNLLCRFCAVYMGVGSLTAPKSTQMYKYYDWSNYRFENTFSQKTTEKKVFDMSNLKASAYEALFGEYQYVQFYVEPTTSFSESSNNNTTQSKLEGFFDSAEGIVKELSFLLDSAAISKQGAALTSFASGIDTIGDKLKGSNENFFSRLLGMSSTVLSGSNVIFPQIWGDAAYNKSYNITINLVSPYGTKEAIYLNIIVPLMHILALSLPRQTTANSYSSPFLVKAFAKGWFSCEMGVIDSISIEKGGQGSWSVDGLPTEVRVQLGVKDLYSNLMIAPNSRPGLFLQNSGMIEFLAVTCGINITKPQFLTKLESIFAMLFNTVTDIPANLYRDFMQKIRNSIDGLWRL